MTSNDTATTTKTTTPTTLSTTTPSPSSSSSSKQRNAELWELLRRSKSRVAQMHAPRIKEENDSDDDDDDGYYSNYSQTPEDKSPSVFSPSRNFQEERREIEGLLQKSKQRLSYGYDMNKLGGNGDDDVVEDVPEINTTTTTTSTNTPNKSSSSPSAAAATPPAEATPSTPSTPSTPKYNRAERKNRKMMQKMGMRKVSGITHATFQTTRHGLYYIERPDVYVSPGTTNHNKQQKKIFIIFGITFQHVEVPEEEQQQQQAYHQNLQQVRQAAQQVTSPTNSNNYNDNKVPVIHEGNEDDESDLDPTDIDMVMKQGFCSRAKAVKALRTHEDIVDAVMALRVE